MLYKYLSLHLWYCVCLIAVALFKKSLEPDGLCVLFCFSFDAMYFFFSLKLVKYFEELGKEIPKWDQSFSRRIAALGGSQK